MKKRKPTKKFIFITAILMSCMIYGIAIYYINSSITSIINEAHVLHVKTHLLVAGLLPVYVGLLVFGLAIMGMYVGSNLQHFLLHHSCRLKK